MAHAHRNVPRHRGAAPAPAPSPMPAPAPAATPARLGHELNNVLMIIEASVYFIEHHGSGVGCADQENLDDLRAALERGKAIAAELLAFGQVTRQDANR
jgi:hypothetical protein